MKETLEEHAKWLRGEGGTRANLSGADLHRADLSGATGNGREIRTLVLGTYHINITKEVMQIGCERHTITEWFGFGDYRIAKMDTGALEWWHKHKALLEHVIEVVA